MSIEIIERLSLKNALIGYKFPMLDDAAGLTGKVREDVRDETRSEFGYSDARASKNQGTYHFFLLR